MVAENNTLKMILYVTNQGVKNSGMQSSEDSVCVEGC